MSARIPSIDDLPAQHRAQARAQLQEGRLTPKTYGGSGVNAITAPGALKSATRKYRNEPIEFQGQTFDSRWELQCWRDLCAQQLAGAIRAVIRQVSLPLPGTRRRIRVDFLLVENSGRIRWLDAKGHESAHSQAKRQQVREAYGIEIELIRRQA